MAACRACRSVSPVLLPLLAGTASGAVWGGVAGVLKVRFGTNEVISTLLLGFIALLMVYGSVQSTDLLRQPKTDSATLPESLPIPDASRLPTLTDDPSSPLHYGLLICLVAAIVTAIVLKRSTFGIRLRAVGLNELAARRAGMPCDALLVAALAIAGALGGLAGAIMIQGEQYSLKAGFSSGYGFDGLVVGLLSRGSATGVLVGALFFGFLRSGGISMEIMAGVPGGADAGDPGPDRDHRGRLGDPDRKARGGALMEENLAVFIASTLRLAMPLVLASSGELVSERAGVLNLSLEGMMLTAAFFGALGSWASGSPMFGVLCAVLASTAVSAVQALLSVRLRANQLVVGIGINIFALGATTLLYRWIFGGLSREQIPGLAKLSIPGLSDIPLLGPALFQHSLLLYAGLALVLAIWATLKYTAFGLAVRAVGDDPRSADRAGVAVARTRILSVLIAGGMAGIGRLVPVGRRHQHLHRKHDQRRRLPGDRGGDLRRLDRMAHPRRLPAVRRSDRVAVPASGNGRERADRGLADAPVPPCADGGGRRGRADRSAGGADAAVSARQVMPCHRATAVPSRPARAAA